MSTMIPLDPHGEYKRAYDVDMLQQQMYGAIMAAYTFRRDTDNLTNVVIARRAGWTRSQVSKLLAGPQNWTLKTIAELCNILDLNFQFVLGDKIDSRRGFSPYGFVSNAQSHVVQNPQMRSKARGRPVLQPIEMNRNFLGTEQFNNIVDSQPVEVQGSRSQQGVE